MTLGKIVGSVVSTQRSDEIPGAKYLLVERCSQRGQGQGAYVVALDPLGAGPEELVIFSQGSSARQTEMSYQKAVDAIIVGIVDLIDERGEIVFKK